MSPESISWIMLLGNELGLPEDTPSWLIATFGILFIYGFVILPMGGLMSYLERKIGADFQARIGPNRAGPAGVLQPFADALKLLQKAPSQDWNWREALWMGVHTMALYSTVAVMPLGSLALLVNTDMSAFLPFWAVLVLAFGTMLLGFSQGSVPGWFGGVRVATQALAGAFPSLIGILCVGIQAGGYRWSLLATVQGASPLTWTIMNPFQFLAFLVFITGGMILLGVPPMDAGVSMADIHGGVASHLHGRRYSLFRFGRFYGFFLWSVIGVTVFLGAWILPFGLSQVLASSGSNLLLGFLELIWLLIKTVLLMLVISSVARIVPRGRVDHITDFSWRVLSPFSLVALIGCSLWVGLRALV